MVLFVLTGQALVACAPTLEVRPFDSAADPVAELRLFESALQDARQDEVNLFAPGWHARAEASAAAAADGSRRGDNGDRVLETVARGRAELARARRHADVARIELRDAYAARTAALHAGAAGLYPAQFDQLEQRFRAAAREVEDDDLGAARRQAKALQQDFRAIELRAIEEHTVGEARRLLQEARRQDAARLVPRSLAQAEQALRETEAFIARQPHAREAIQQRAARVLSLARRTQLMQSQAQRWSATGPEEQLLRLDRELANLEARVVGEETAKRGQSLEDRLRHLDEGIKALLDSRQFVNAELGRLRLQMRELTVEMLRRETELQERIQRQNERLERQSAEEARINRELLEQKQLREAEQERAERFERARRLFDPDEAEIYRRGSDLLIRLKGLSFEVGEAVLRPEHYPLLAKVHNVIRMFDTRKIVVEGHTDTTGASAFNQELSRRRAAAVMAYLVNNNAVASDDIAALGYGPERPIAANTTADGRRLNRRIDVVLSVR